VVGILALLVGTSMLAIRIPVPCVHDEFSYLLAADTFSHGRLTNPAHPLWEHFESFHIIQQPSYASKYQPGQGMLLALGNLLSGYPAMGACLGTALAAMATCWMLQGWLPVRWAWLGGLLVALHGMIQIRWSLGYWGGELPMTGGALLFGALPRLTRIYPIPRVRDSLGMALGALILAATRPYEGLIASLCVLAALAWWLLGRRRPSLPLLLTRVVLPALALMGFGLGGLAFFNHQVTGNWLRLPYQVYETTYGCCPLFLWQAPKQEPKFHHEVMRKLQAGWGVQDYNQQQSLGGLLQAKAGSALKLWKFYLGIPLTLPLFALPWLLTNRRLQFAWLALLVSYASSWAVPWTFPHYVAPIAPLVVLVVVQGMRYFQALGRRGQRWALAIVPVVLVWHIATLVQLCTQYATWDPQGWQWDRERIRTELENKTRPQLVLVHYAADHNGHAEWVYNLADIDRSKVVWARSMGPERDQELLDYFPDRQTWLLEADTPHPQLQPIARQSSLVRAGG